MLFCVSQGVKLVQCTVLKEVAGPDSLSCSDVGLRIRLKVMVTCQKKEVASRQC